MGTKNKPGEFDCYADAHPDEPMFVLLGRDVVAAPLVRLWVAARQKMKSEPALESEAMQCASRMREWAETLGKSTFMGEGAFEDAVLELAEIIRKERGLDEEYPCPDPDAHEDDE